MRYRWLLDCMEAKEIVADDAGWLRCAGGESALGADHVLELGMMSRSEQASAALSSSAGVPASGQSTKRKRAPGKWIR